MPPPSPNKGNYRSLQIQCSFSVVKMIFGIDKIMTKFSDMGHFAKIL